MWIKAQGAAFAPFSVGSDPASETFVVRDLEPPAGVDEPRYTRRRRLLDAVNLAVQLSCPVLQGATLYVRGLNPG